MKTIKVTAFFLCCVFFLNAQETKPECAVVTYAEGSAQVMRPGGKKEKINIGSQVFKGDTIQTFNNSRINLKLPTGIEMQIKKPGVIKLTELTMKADRNESQINVLYGNVAAKVEKLSAKANSFSIATPTVIAGVRGTFFEVDVSDQQVILSVYEGQVEVKPASGQGAGVTINSGYTLSVESSGVIGEPVKIKNFETSSPQSADLTPPIINITAPAGGQGISSSELFTLQFTVIEENLASVDVNKKTVAEAAAGSLISVPVVLRRGENTIIITARDQAGNTASETVRIEYKLIPPRPPSR
ncbi:MAG TPA: hypothetical protein DC049_01245 [Spirochaetia bacterium]|nr:hypothetical protein [Spirochaetia bacterium]